MAPPGGLEEGAIIEVKAARPYMHHILTPLIYQN